MSPPNSIAQRAWMFREGVHAVAIEEDLVFLDVHADAYLSLPGGAACVGGLESGRISVVDPAFAEELRQAELIVPTRGRTAPQAPSLPDLPRRSLEPLVSGKPSWRDWVDASHAMIDVLVNFWRKPFSTLLDRPLNSGDVLHAPSPEVVELVHRFHRWIPYAPLPGKCLLRSFILLGLLQRAGLAATWVIAVRTWPFAAHCWLQVGEVVLDDHHERLVAFTPILAI